MAVTDSSDAEQEMLRVTTTICEAIVSRDYYCDKSTPIIDPLTAATAIHESDEYRSLTKKIEQLFKAMASSDMDSRQTEAFLTSQMKRRPHGTASSETADVVSVITETQSAALAKFWMANRARIHEAIVRRSAWTSSPSIYRGSAWRTYDTTQSRHRPSPDVTSSTVAAVLEITSQNKQKLEDSIQFQMDSNGVRRLMDRLDEVDARLSAAAATSSDLK